MSRIGSAQECPASHQDIPVTQYVVHHVLRTYEPSRDASLAQVRDPEFFVHQVRLRLGPPLPALPTHYVKIKVNEIFGHFVLASRQAQTHPGDPSFGRLHVRRVDLQTDRHTDRGRQAGADRQGQTDRGKQTDTDRLVEGVCSIFPELVQETPSRQTDRSKHTAPNRQLQTNSSKQTAPNRHLQPASSSLRGIWEPQKSLGSSEAEKLSIPSRFVIVLNTFGSPARFQFFWLLATLQVIDRQRQPCRRFVFNIPRACAGK